MTMNRKEQAELAALKGEVAIARALRWTDGAERDLPPPKHGGTVTQGWDFNEYRREAYPAWSSCISHGHGVYIASPRGIGGSKARALFTTEERALRALRHMLERMSAEALAQVDAKLEALRGAA